MDDDGLRPGHLIALAGVAVLVVSLWLPWFDVRLGAGARDEVNRGVAQFGAPLAAIAAGVLDQLDGLRLTAWDAFDGEDVALAAGAGLVALVLLAAAGAAGPGVRIAPASAGGVARLGGVLLGALVAYRLVQRPGPSEVLGLAPGGWVALAGCGLMVAGGTLAARTRVPRTVAHAPGQDGWAPAPAPAHAGPQTSVPPPGSRGTAAG